MILIIKSAAVLKKLSDNISKKNVKKDAITDGEVDALEKGLQTVLNSFKQLADFKQDHSGMIAVLTTMPVDESLVSALQAEMPK